MRFAVYTLHTRLVRHQTIDECVIVVAPLGSVLGTRRDISDAIVDIWTQERVCEAHKQLRACERNETASNPHDVLCVRTVKNDCGADHVAQS